MLCRSGLAPAPNVPNPRNAGRKKSNPVWEFFTDLRGHGLAGVRCRFCHWVTNDRSPTTMKFHLKRKHDTGAGGLWSICEEKINSQAPATYAPRSRKADDILLKAFGTPRPFQSFSPFATAEVKLTEQLQAAKKTEKISKRKSDALKTGLKVTYRCNSWKRTRCPFQMYALHSNDGKIYLYESGGHDHRNNCKAYTSNLETLRARRRKTAESSSERETSPSLFDASAQDDFLTSLIQQAQSMVATPPEATDDSFGSQENEGISLSDSLFLNRLNESANTRQEEDGSSSSASGLIPASNEFQLADGSSLAALLQIATDSDLQFTFNSRRCLEYCFESNKTTGRMVVFSDGGGDIRVAQRINDEEVNVETWRKSDWKQFCWAVRGTCLHFLKT